MADAELMTIGEFSAVTQLTARALRYYEGAGLLSPVHVHPDTGYRYYSRIQQAEAHRIRMLREAGLSVSEIATLLEPGADEATVRAVLEQRRSALADDVLRQQAAIRSLDRLLATRRPTMALAVTTRTIEAQPIAAFRRRSPAALPWGNDLGPEFARLAQAVLGGGGAPVQGIGLANAYDVDVVDVELGFVTDLLVGPIEGMITRVADGGTFACVQVLGFDRLGDGFEALSAWTEANDAERRGAVREYLPLHTELFALDDPPEEVAERYRTEVPIEIAIPIY